MVVTPPAPPVSEPVGAAVAAPASLDVVASLEDAGVPEILAQDLDTAEGLLEPFATLEPTRNGHVEPSPITIREPEPVIRDLELAIPAFLTVVLMPFTYSISVGIGAGFVAYVFIKVVLGKAREVHPLMWIVAALFVVYFAYTPISGWLS